MINIHSTLKDDKSYHVTLQTVHSKMRPAKQRDLRYWLRSEKVKIF